MCKLIYNVNKLSFAHKIKKHNFSGLCNIVIIVQVNEMVVIFFCFLTIMQNTCKVIIIVKKAVKTIITYLNCDNLFHYTYVV